MVVAIDGPAGAGKSTVARAVADALGFSYLDSGAMYRALALSLLEKGGRASDRAREVKIEIGDRVKVDGLSGLGADIEATDDGFVVHGGEGIEGGTLDARGDHRMAMLGAVAGLASRDGVEVVGMEASAVSYPGFERDLAALLGA